TPRRPRGGRAGDRARSLRRSRGGSRRSAPYARDPRRHPRVLSRRPPPRAHPRPGIADQRVPARPPPPPRRPPPPPLRPALTRARESRISEYRPAPPPGPMSAAPFLLRDDGRPDWGAMWESFCGLALYVGPAHPGP